MTPEAQAQDPADSRDALAFLMNQEVVVDTVSSYVYIGRLVEATPAHLTLADADVRDSSEGKVTKEHYAFEASRYGYRKNRRRVVVWAEKVISISLLSDIMD